MIDQLEKPRPTHLLRVGRAAAFLVLFTTLACGAEEGTSESTGTEGPPSEPAEPTPDPGGDEFPAGDPAVGTPSGEMRTLTSTPEMIATGRASFATCMACHGEEGVGNIGLGPALNSETFLAAASDEYLARTIYRGRAGTTMIPWGATLGRDGVDAVVAYMRSWQEVEPATLDESAVEGDIENGEAVFASICAACHGNTGAGYAEIANGTGIGRTAFLADVSNGYLRYMIAHGKTGTAMRPFARPAPTAVANLTNEEIENVIAFLRANAT